MTNEEAWEYYCETVPLPTPKVRIGIPSARFQYFTFQGGTDAQVRDEIERGDLIARFSKQRRYPSRRVANGKA